MSTDNYRVCPRCIVRAVKKYKADCKHLEEAYGQVSREEYEKLKAELGGYPITGKMPETLREVLEIFTNSSGVFAVWYGCTCEACDFTFDFKHEEILEIDDDE